MKRYYSINSDGKFALHDTNQEACNAISETDSDLTICPQNPPGTHGVLIQTGHCCRCDSCGGDAVTGSTDSLYDEFPWIPKTLKERNATIVGLQAEVDRLRSELSGAIYCAPEESEHCPA